MRTSHTEQRVLFGALLVLVTLILHGCMGNNGRKCQIIDVLPMIQVNGRSGLSQEQLDRAGVVLCARNEPAESDTYGGGSCNRVSDVFPDGTLPDALEMDDRQPVLLVKCPGTSSDTNGQGLQRVTCSTDVYIEKPDGPVRKESMLHINGQRLSENCLTDKTGWEGPNDLVKAEDAESSSDGKDSDKDRAESNGDSDNGDKGSGGKSTDKSPPSKDDSSDKGGDDGDKGNSGESTDKNVQYDDSANDKDGGGGTSPCDDSMPTPAPCDDRSSSPCPPDPCADSSAPSPSSRSSGSSPTPEPYEPYWVYEDRRRRTPGSYYLYQSDLQSRVTDQRADLGRGKPPPSSATLMRSENTDNAQRDHVEAKQIELRRIPDAIREHEVPHATPEQDALARNSMKQVAAAQLAPGRSYPSPVVRRESNPTEYLTNQRASRSVGVDASPHRFAREPPIDTAGSMAAPIMTNER